jgi:hypothetical protein
MQVNERRVSGGFYLERNQACGCKKAIDQRDDSLHLEALGQDVHERGDFGRQLLVDGTDAGVLQACDHLLQLGAVPDHLPGTRQ